MGKILVIAEKPSVGRDIARVLGCRGKRQGALEGEHYIVSWAVGHLVTLCDPEDYTPQWKKWRMDVLPMMPKELKLKAISKTKDQLKVLKELMAEKEVTSLICATDSGREGELIFRYIYQILGCKKPVQRLWISSMTDQAIGEGFARLKDSKEYDNLYFSAQCRAEADWLVGMNASRAYSLQYNALLSIGRVQTPTLAMIVARQKEIDAFDSRDYWEVVADFGAYRGTWFLGDVSETKIFEQEKAAEIAAKVKGQEGVITKVEVEEMKKAPPLLYDLTELQRDCNTRYGFSAQKTLTLAQNLYEKWKMITYPRTDSRYLSEDMKGKVQKTLQKLSAIPAYEKWGKYICDLPAIPFSKRIIDNGKVTDHHAIIPTDGRLSVEKLPPEEQKVFHLIALRFLAVFLPPYEYDVTKVTTEVDGETFYSRGMVVRHLGWNILYYGMEETKKKKKKEEEKLPPLAEGERYVVSGAKVEKKKTTPPKPYTEAALLSAMENAGRFVEEEDLKEQLKDSGLGTPATRAAIIERLLKVGYVVRKGKALIPTQKGMQLIQVVPEELKSPQTTGRWEKGLSSIAKGKLEREKFMASIGRFVYFLVEQAKGADQTVVFEAERGKKQKGSLGTCPLCKENGVFENSKAFFCGGWRRGCKFSIWKDALSPNGKEIDRAMAKKLLKDGRVDGVPLTLPQTGETGVGTVLLKADRSGALEVMNFQRDTK